MKARTKHPRKLHILLKELKEHRIIQNLFFYSIGAVGLLASVYEISSADRIRRVFLVLCITGAPIVMIASYFHGKGGRNPITVVEVLLLSLFVLTGGSIAAKILLEPKPITILIRFMKEQEDWSIKNIIKRFEQENHCKVTIKRFEDDRELIRILENERQVKRKSDVSLVKTPMHLTLLLVKEGIVKSLEDYLSDLELHRIENEYDPVALKMCSFSRIRRKKLFFLPRKLEVRLMGYRKSKVADAVENWHRFRAQLNEIMKKENGYGLPRDYNLEADVDNWDFYDLFVVGYYWANTEYNGKKTGRIAHRSKNYFETDLGLIDRALQLGASEEDIYDRYKFSEAIIDMLHWEAIFRKYGLYCKAMWKGDGLSGSGIYEEIKTNSVYLAWIHQLDCLEIHGCEQLKLIGRLDNKEDLGVAKMSRGVSFELTNDGLPKRTGTKRAHIYGWFWGIPKTSPEPELAYKLAAFITSEEPHLKECKAFLLIPVRKDVQNALKKNLKSTWKYEPYTKSIEQLRINGENFVPRFKTLDDYQEFHDNYYDAFEEVIIKRRYSPGGPKGRIDREFIREHLR